MIVLDTNVIAELMRPQPEPAVLAWADGLASAEVAITAMNEAEILHGLAQLPAGRRKQALLDSWQSLVTALLGNRVLAFHREAAQWYGELLARREQLGRPITTADAVIAATALAQGAQLATRNVSDFTGLGLDLINPWP
ncbi:type II toxin-antitoxin system VapC family toxin [Synechococcus sp. CCY 0621]|uniref:type II toxin-antitoxin system VapC family toxin n=1 Tax=Synechococcus sp. CCY 0621 TaxID=2815603 RepID=UPI001C2141CF